MAKKAMLSAWDDVRAVMDELPDGAEIESVHLSDMGVGQTRALITLTRGIEEVATVFCAAKLEVEQCPSSSRLEIAYFVVGGVSVQQYRKGRENEEAP